MKDINEKSAKIAFVLVQLYLSNILTINTFVHPKTYHTNRVCQDLRDTFSEWSQQLQRHTRCRRPG